MVRKELVKGVAGYTGDAFILPNGEVGYFAIGEFKEGADSMRPMIYNPCIVTSISDVESGLIDVPERPKAKCGLGFDFSKKLPRRDLSHFA